MISDISWDLTDVIDSRMITYPTLETEYICTAVVDCYIAVFIFALLRVGECLHSVLCTAVVQQAVADAPRLGLAAR